MKRLLTAALFLAVGLVSVAHAATVTVNSANLATGSPCPSGTCLNAYTNPVWFFYNDETDVLDNSLGSFVTGPGTPLTGHGSAQISVSGSQRRNLATYQFRSTPLAAITTLKYTTYNPSAGNFYGPNASAYLNFNVDFNGSDTWQKRLIYLPVDNAPIVADSWKTWDCLNGGNALWEYSGANWPAPISAAGTTKLTWNQILTAWPSIRIRATDSWFGLRVGEPYPAGYTENIDNLTFGTAAGTTTFDFEAGPTNNVIAPVAPVVCITPFNPCVTVPMNVTRTDGAGVRLYDVTFQLSPNLALCHGSTSDIAYGGYLGPIGGTTYQVVDNGGGSYTVDCAILGNTPGITTATGTLFTINLKNVGGDGTGTVTVTNVTLRNPLNQPVAADPGAPASITIDNTAPTALSGVTAALQQTGNPAGGTTNINLSWPAVPAGSTVTLFRKGYGGYPEYTGSVPASPGSYPPAGWSLVASLPSGVTSYTDPAGTESETIDFESYSLGSINGQDGWTRTGSYDHVVDVSGGASGFGAHSLRISDAYTSGSFADMTFAKPLVNPVGETGATAGAFTGGTRRTHFEVQFDLASVLPTLQPGMTVSMSPDRGDGSRMSYLRFEDWADGIHVFFDDVEGTSNPANFVETDIATLSRTPHRIRLSMTCVDGPSNDVVQVFVDGALKITGTSWENYYRYDTEAAPEPTPRIVKTVIFRTSATAHPADLGKGFLFDNLTLSSGGTGTRDFWYYTAYVNDPCGNFSGAAPMTAGTLNYHLGDVAGGVGLCSGDNQVDGLDISLLGANYGKNDSWILSHGVACLDVGPTSTGYVDGRPLTDDVINFEDLILFAINFSVVSAPQMSAVPVAGRDELTVDAPASVTAGQTFVASVRMSGAGTVQGLSAQLGWDPAVAEPVSTQAGEWMTGQQGVVFSARPGNVDAAVLGTGRAITGTGELAQVTFRALSNGNPGVKLATVDARNTSNQRMELSRGVVVPSETALMPVAPNPFRGSPTLAFAVSKAGPVELAVYSVDGRRVRTLVKDTREAGVYRLSWDGTDDHGTAQRAGLYFVRLVTAQGRFTRTMAMLK